MSVSLVFYHIQPLPLVPTLFVASVACPFCQHPNVQDFQFCQRCGYRRRRASRTAPVTLRGPVDWSEIEIRKQSVLKSRQSSPYVKQKSSPEKEFLAFLKRPLGKDIFTATPHDVVNFLVWEDQFGKTVAHKNACPFFWS